MLKLRRSYLDNCTIGKIYHNGNFICYTVERSWLNNAKSISCVPAGEYKLESYSSAKYQNCFALSCASLSVGFLVTHQRTHILIHPANYHSELEGGIGPGLDLHPHNWGVAHSRKAMDKLRDLIKSENITEIKIT